MARRPKTATVYDITQRTRANGTVSHVVRWKVPGRSGTCQRTFTDPEAATDLQQTLSEAAVDRERFDVVTGLPQSMVADDGVTVAELCREFLVREAAGYAPLSRRNWCDDLVPLIVRSAPDRAPELTDEQRLAIRDWLIAGDPLPKDVDRWIRRWSPRLCDLERADLVRILDRCSKKEDLLSPLALTSRRNRIGHVKQILNEAAERGVAMSLDWPPKRGGAQKKSERPVDRRDWSVVSPDVLGLVVEASVNRDPRSHKYGAMSACSGWGGLRPSEVFGLEVSDLTLPKLGWGAIAVDEARVPTGVRWAMDGDKEYDEPKSKNSVRKVPIPPQLVEILRVFVAGKTGRLFPGGSGFRHWPESLDLAAGKVGAGHLCPYDLRRAYASHLSAAGVPFAEIADRMGNTVAILLKHYIKPVQGSADASNALAEGFYGSV